MDWFKNMRKIISARATDVRDSWSMAMVDIFSTGTR